MKIRLHTRVTARKKKKTRQFTLSPAGPFGPIKYSLYSLAWVTPSALAMCGASLIYVTKVEEVKFIFDKLHQTFKFKVIDYTRTAIRYKNIPIYLIVFGYIYINARSKLDTLNNQLPTHINLLCW